MFEVRKMLQVICYLVRSVPRHAYNLARACILLRAYKKRPLLVLASSLLVVSHAPTVFAVPKNSIVSEHTGKTFKAKSTYRAKPSKDKIKVYKYSKEGTASFSDRAPQGKTYEVLTYKCYACDINSKIDWYSIRLYPEKFADIIDKEAAEHGVDAALVRAVIHAESAFRPSIQSHKGAVGLMQLMPATAADLGVSDREDPHQNIDGGVRYLAWLLDMYDGDITLATAAYNAGPGAVNRHGGVPPYAETEAYVERVSILAGRYRS